MPVNVKLDIKVTFNQGKYLWVIRSRL